jgi:acetylcholinesterase
MQRMGREMEVILTAGKSYRVNIFGFPNAAGLKGEELNLGLLDQRLGLEWYVYSHDHSMDTDRSR